MHCWDQQGQLALRLWILFPGILKSLQLRYWLPEIILIFFWNRHISISPIQLLLQIPDHYLQLKNALQDTNIKVYAGNDAVEQVVTSSTVDVVIASIVGYSGVRPTIAAIKAGKKIALANKETLVVAGEIIEKLVRESGSIIIPVDSEHSAIFQCLAGESGNPVEKITLTASGGPFLNYVGRNAEEC